jgi:dienelactone hydrolase
LRNIRWPVLHLLSLSIVVLAAAPASAAAVASVFGGRLPCHVESGVQLCAGSVATRVESWDGVPLDANLTLPATTSAGPFPLIVQLHGWSQGKSDGAFVDRARDGYAVLSYTARGFHGSCGSEAARAPDPTLADPNVCTERGWTHLSDARYEARDTQYLAGLLVDEGLVDPQRIGVTGASYGGGQSLILAALNDRVMLPSGQLIAWRSPAGTPLHIAAAAPVVPWSDLAAALTPNGRTLDYRVDNSYGSRVGIQKKSWNATLYGAGLGSGYYAPGGVDPSADLIGWNARTSAGEPYDDDPEVRAVIAELTRFHSGYYIDDSTPPAPLFIYNAWTDDLFPVDEAQRYWSKVVARHPDADIALHFEDGFGHPRAGLGGDIARVQGRIDDFFALHLKDADVAPPPRIEVYPQACNGAPAGSGMSATGGSYLALQRGEVRSTTARTQRFTSAAGDPGTAAATDPLSGGPCRTVAASDDPAAATYRLPAATGAGYTLVGAPTVLARLSVHGSFAQIASRLWDVAPDGTQTLVTHDLYRTRTDHNGRDVFQLHPNAWRFAAGHVAKLELLGQSEPYGRASNGSFSVDVQSLDLRLPVAESPDGDAIKAPAAHVFPAAEGRKGSSRACRLASSGGDGGPACPSVAHGTSR